MCRLVPAFAVLALTSAAAADSQVSVQLSQDGQQLASSLGLSPAELEMRIKSRIDEAYQTANVDGFLRAFTDATTFSARGLGVDYASAPRSFLFGFGVNVAAAGNGGIDGEGQPTASLAANLAIMAGLNLAEWDLPRWTIFASGFHRTASTEQLRGGLTSAGAHLQYRLAQPTESGGAGTALRWIGLSATSGIELTRWNLGLVNNSLTTDLAVEGVPDDVAVSSTGRFDLTSTALTVPVELTTGLRIALIATVYVGVGLDFTVGKTTLDANLTGQMSTPGVDDVGTVTVTADGSSGGSPAQARGIVGAQVNLWKLKIFAQANASAIPAASIGFGIRLVN